MLKSYLSKLFALTALLLATSVMFAQNAPVSVTAPAGIAGDYLTAQAVFGTFANGESGSVVLIDDGAGATTGCVAAANDLTGAIALIDRGGCPFAVKAKNAQNAGAIAVIICNNATFPDSIFAAGGVDCSLTIPAVMMSNNNCQIIKAELVNGVTATLPSNTPAAGEAIGVEIPLAGAGTYTVDAITGSTPVFTGSTAAKVYSIVAPMDAVMNINSCLGGIDTRLFVVQGCRGNGGLTIIGAADDECELEPGGDEFASDLNVIVKSGETYIIVWDDAYDATGFDFTVSFSTLPSVDVTFNVDMKDETVSPDGVKIGGNFTGGSPADMTDNGDGTWSYTTTVTAGDELQYKFGNGAAPEDSPDLSGCGVDDGAGGFNRIYVAGLENEDLSLVCFNSCTVCPPDEACPSWIKEDFESYTLGGLSAQSDDWAPWTPGNATEDALVSDEQAVSGTKSMKVANANGDDQLLLLGNRTSGNYVLKWKVYIPTGSAGYYNIQKNQNTPGSTGNTGLQVDFFVDGTGNIDAGAQNNVAFTYPHDTWFEVFHYIDLDNDWMRMWVDGKAVHEWPASWQSFAQNGLKQIGAVNFYGNTNNLYYIDDVLLKQVEACPDVNTIICDGFDGYAPGALDAQSPWWGTWTPGNAGEDGLVSSEQFLSCEQALKISAAGGDDVLLLLGLRTAGFYAFAWDMYIPAGFSGYYNVQKKVTAATANADFSFASTFAANGTATIDVGVAAANTFAFPHDEWFNVLHIYDLDNNYAALYINDELIMEWAANLTATQGAGLKQIGSVDFFGNTGDQFYVDNVLFAQFPSVPGNICGGAIDLNQYLGQGQNTTTSTPLFDNTEYFTTGYDPQNPATGGFDCFGEPDGTASDPSLENTVWYTFTGDGETYFIETAQCGSTNYVDFGDTQMAIYTGTCSNLTPVACNEDILPMPIPNEFPAGLELATTIGTVYRMMIDGFAGSAGEYCIKFTQLTGTPVADITFRVDMKNVTVSAQGVRIRFQGAAADENMTLVSGKLYEITKTIAVGEVVNYNFKNGSAQVEPSANLSTCGVSNGAGGFFRTYTVPNANTTLPYVCYSYCVTCDLVVGSDETAFARALGINPNPASGFANITYNFEESTDLNVRLVNTLGQVLMTRDISNALTGNLKLDLSSLPSGAYSVVFSNGTAVTAKRLVVN